MSTPIYKKARAHLSRNCPVMKRVIGIVGPCTMASIPGDPFTLLVRCVISQQISTKAARSIFGKLLELVGDVSIPMANLANLSESQFKACGLSGPKQRTLRAVIDHVQANPNLLPGITAHDDETVHEQLTQIKGIGPWTADMFLMFGISRPDVLPVGDYGVRVAIQKQFRLRKLPDAAKCLKIGKPWTPYRSVASWYLWRSLEPQYQQLQKDE
ncbi:MAG TPA: DNA-3-methyladenine glycosylase [Gemmata sp.]|nr:DNA-3-methyladenine glycosylase [Gemmata sp.]